MRVLLDCRMASWSGVGRYTCGLARALAKRDDVEIVQVVEEGCAAPASDAEVVRAAAHPFTPAGGLELGRIARRAAPDIVHSLHFPTPIPAPHPLVVTLHDLTPLIVPSVMRAFPHRLGYRIWNARAARVADAILANSESTARDIARIYPAAVSKTRVVLHAAEDFAVGPVGDLPPRLLPTDAPYLLSMGNVKPHKGLPTLLAAFERVASAHPDLHLLLVGKDVEGYAATHLRDARLATRVHFTGAVDDAVLRALYRSAAAFVFPSTYEGFGLPPLEAMSVGTPVVCSSAASLPEVVGDAAILFPAGDDGALVAALVTLLDDASVVARLRAAGPAQAARFTWTGTADATYVAYAELLRGR